MNGHVFLFVSYSVIHHFFYDWFQRLQVDNNMRPFRGNKNKNIMNEPLLCHFLNATVLFLFYTINLPYRNYHDPPPTLSIISAALFSIIQNEDNASTLLIWQCFASLWYKAAKVWKIRLWTCALIWKKYTHSLGLMIFLTVLKFPRCKCFC